MTTVLKNTATLLCLASLAACASFMSDSRTLKFKDNVTVTTIEGRETQYKAGEVIPMPREPVQVEAPGQVGVIIVPASGGAGVTELKMRRIDSWSGPELNREVNQRLNRVLERVVEAQKFLSKRQGSDALRVISELQGSMPELSYLEFLKASAHVVNGDREKARAAVEAGLSSFPDNASGRALARSLGAEQR
jgi:hypothetical protein